MKAPFKKIGEVARLKAGGDKPKNTIKGQKEASISHPYPVYSNGVGEDALYGFADTYDVEGKAVTISGRGTIGYHAVRKGKFTPIIRLITVLPDEDVVSAEYVNYVLYSLGLGGTSGGIPQLTVPMVKKYKIPVPSLAVQNEIVAVLDKYDELIRVLEEEVKLREEEVDALSLSLLKKGRERPFQDIATFTRGITFSKNDQINGSTGVPVLRANNIDLRSKTLIEEDLIYVDSKVKIKPDQFYKKNDILICAGSGSKEHIGKVAFAREDTPYSFGGFMGVIRATEEVLPKYLYYILTSKNFSDFLKKKLESSTINNLNIRTLSKFSMPVPSLEEQQRIVSILDTLSNYIQTLKDEIILRKEQFDLLRNQLLAFEEE